MTASKDSLGRAVQCDAPDKENASAGSSKPAAGPDFLKRTEKRMRIGLSRPRNRSAFATGPRSYPLPAILDELARVRIEAVVHRLGIAHLLSLLLDGRVTAGRTQFASQVLSLACGIQSYLGVAAVQTPNFARLFQRIARSR
jgi:hypothetical protein